MRACSAWTVIRNAIPILFLFLLCSGCVHRMQSLEENPDSVHNIATLTGIKVSEDARQVEISADRRLVYSFYKNAYPPKAVIDLAQTEPGAAANSIDVNRGAIKRIAVNRHEAAGGVLTRVEIALANDEDVSVSNEGVEKTKLLVVLKKQQIEGKEAEAEVKLEEKPIKAENVGLPSAAGAAATPVTTSLAVNDRQFSAKVRETTIPTAAVGKKADLSEKVDSVKAGTPLTGGKGYLLTAITTGAETVDLAFAGGSPSFTAFRLSDPKRLVLDIAEAKDGLTAKTVAIDRFGFGKARIGASPGKVRIVFDTIKNELPPYRVVKSDHGLKIIFKGFAAAVKPASEPSSVTNRSSVAQPVVGNAKPAIKAASTEQAAVASKQAALPVMAVPAVAAKTTAGLSSPEPATVAIKSVAESSAAIQKPGLIPLPAVAKPSGERTAAAEPPTAAAARPVKAKPAEAPHSTATTQSLIEKIDFKSVGDFSQISLKVTGSCSEGKPQKVGTGWALTIKNCQLPKNLQRALDTGGFASSVKEITPYQVRIRNGYDAKLLVKLRAETPFNFRREGDTIYWEIRNPEGMKGPAPLPAVAKVDTVPKLEGAQPPPAEVAREATGSLPVVAKAQTTLPPQPVAATPVAAAVVKKAKPASSLERDLAPEQTDHQQKVFSGRRVTLEFSDAEVRKIFQLIAEVSNLNFLVADDVSGSISLKLVNVPWDQALEVILESKGLEKRQEGNILYIKPKGRFRTAAQEEDEARRDLEKRMEMITRVFDVNFASIGDIERQFRELSSKLPGSSIIPDSRTNKLIVVDNETRLKNMEDLLVKLDAPEKQVMIEARIVEASSSFTRDLGVQWGLHYRDGSSSLLGINQLDTGFGGVAGAPPTAGTFGPGAAVGMSFGKLTSNIQIDLRLAAAASAGLVKIISTPKVVTLNNKTAKISQGQSIPYLSTSAEGTKTEFIEATLSLDVTPHVTADGNIGLKVKATNNSPGTGNPPPINKKEATTELQVMNGETTVIGGIYVDSDTESNTGVPFLMDIPLLGWLFKSNAKQKTKTELLIFITPRIVG